MMRNEDSGCTERVHRWADRRTHGECIEFQCTMHDALCTPLARTFYVRGTKRSAPKECRLQVGCTPLTAAPDRKICHVEVSTHLRWPTCICTAARSLGLPFCITSYVYGGASRRISKLSRRRVPENGAYYVKNAPHANQWDYNGTCSWYIGS
jgi:hypothetical protein